ncbi:hypothetical protein IJ670_01120, partial [bacterium]|nr:hypothetical protein [bacterium]
MPIYFLWGDEDYLIEKAVNKIKKDVLKDDINALNYRYLDNPDFPMFSQTLRTAPMMFGDIVVSIKCQNYFLEVKNKISLDDKQNTEIVNAFKNVSDSVHIVLICPIPRGEKKKPDSRKKIYKELSKITKPIEYPSFKTYEESKIVPHVQKIAEELGLKISSQNALHLIRVT